MAQHIHKNPALTEEEWANGYNSADLHIRLRSSSGTPGPRVGVDVIPTAYPLGGILGDERDIHALAAFCLAEQPFGFTREDVERNRRDARREKRHVESLKEVSTSDERQTHIVRLLRLEREYTSCADRIEALLPPEKD